MDDYSDGISPQTAGLLLTLCGLVGGAFFVGLWFMNKTEDPLYERDPRFFQYVPKSGGNSPEMFNTSTLWKDKRSEPQETPPPAAPVKPPVIEQELFKMPTLENRKPVQESPPKEDPPTSQPFKP